jgi:hypothetical protein
MNELSQAPKDTSQSCIFDFPDRPVRPVPPIDPDNPPNPPTDYPYEPILDWPPEPPVDPIPGEDPIPGSNPHPYPSGSLHTILLDLHDLFDNLSFHPQYEPVNITMFRITGFDGSAFIGSPVVIKTLDQAVILHSSDYPNIPFLLDGNIGMVFNYRSATTTGLEKFYFIYKTQSVTVMGFPAPICFPVVNWEVALAGGAGATSCFPSGSVIGFYGSLRKPADCTGYTLISREYLQCDNTRDTQVWKNTSFDY